MLSQAFRKGASRFGVDIDKLLGFGKADDTAAPEEANGAEAASSLARALTGTIGALGEFYFPPDLIGGSCPRVVGEEEEIVWNAAAEACDSERIHVVWQSSGNRIWYLAARSAEMASYPNSWCPFASLLPGMTDAEPSPICYTYFSDEAATMMTVTQDGLQIHRGLSSVVRAKAERSSRELNNAPIVELVPDRISKLTPMPWYSLSLFENRARRVLAAMSVFAALGIAALAFVIWLLATMVIIANRASLGAAEARTATKTMELMRDVSELRVSPMRQQLADFASLNDGLLSINGFLDIYEIKDDKVRWRAIIPPSVTADRIIALGGKTIGTTADGIAIGNADEIAYEAAEAAKRR